MSWGRARTHGGLYSAVVLPRLKNLYNRRAERLRELAENNPLGDFLRFAALVAHAQEVVLYDHPLQMDLTARIKEANAQGKPPLDIHVLPRDKHWQKLLHSLIAELKPEMSGTALAVIENLEKASEQELEEMASALFASDFSLVSSDKAPFIWAALSLYWAQMASLIPAKLAPNTARRASSAGLRLYAGIEHGANRYHSGAALPALQPV